MPRGKFDSTNQNHYPDLGSEASSVSNFSLISQTSLGGENSGSVAKRQLFSQAIKYEAKYFSPITYSYDSLNIFTVAVHALVEIETIKQLRDLLKGSKSVSSLATPS